MAVHAPRAGLNLDLAAALIILTIAMVVVAGVPLVVAMLPQRRLIVMSVIATALRTQVVHALEKLYSR